MADSGDAIAQLMAITGYEYDQAQQFLEVRASLVTGNEVDSFLLQEHNWDVNAAVETYFALESVNNQT